MLRHDAGSGDSAEALGSEHRFQTGERLDHLIIFKRRFDAEFWRHIFPTIAAATHQVLGKDTPDPRSMQRRASGESGGSFSCRRTGPYF
jgi:hypothetical protein